MVTYSEEKTEESTFEFDKVGAAEESTFIDEKHEKPFGNKAVSRRVDEYPIWQLAHETVHDFSTRCLMK